MIRLPLNKGDVVQLNNRQYNIEAVIGDGATCIVYSAYYLDSMGLKHRVNLKECYPYSARIRRREQSLNWEIESEKKQCMATFCSSYEKLMIWQNENFAVNVFDLCEANNTFYIIMNADKGKTFDKDNAESLHDILNTVKLLAHFVGKYHENGYLHLDIKPSNFLVYPRPSEHIVLFDMDTVTPIADINDGKMKCVSYSDGWAAPEQKQGKISKLCPATDIFSIGAILFDKVMGRPVAASDMSVFADWDFDGELFDEVNPKIKRLLRDVFRRTLAANPNRRYQDVADLAKNLQKGIDITIDGKPFLIGNCPPITNEFIGRNVEMSQIKRAFDAGGRAVFLRGEGGIGKSMLAIAYAERYQQKYDAAFFMRYKGSLESLVDDIEIQNVDSDSDDRQKVLRRLLDKNVLLIVDNFDVEIDHDDFLEDLLQFKANILFTTRTDFSSVSGGQTTQIEIGQLCPGELTRLFSRASGIQADEKQQPYLKKLFKAVGYNTYAIELLGLQIAASGYSLETLSAKITGGLDSFMGSEKVRTKKDGRVVKRTIPEVIRVLFQIANLSEVRQQVLRNMYLLRFLNITRDTYAEFACESAPGMDVLNDMLELGWVRKNGVYFVLHPLVEQLVEHDLTPNMDNCPAVYYSISRRIRYCCDFDDYSDAAEERYDQTCDFLCAFFCNVSLEPRNNRELLLSWLMGIIENENTELGSPVHSYFQTLYERLANLILNKKTTPEETLKIRYIILEAWVREFGTIYCGNTDYNEKMERLRQENLKDAFRQTVDATQFLEISEREKALDHIYELLFNVSWLFSTHKMPAEFIQQLYRERPQACTLSAREKKDRGLPLTAEELAEIEKFYEDNPVFAPGYTDDEIDEEQKSKQGFRDAEDKIAFIAEIINNQDLPAFKRAELVWYCTDMIFSPLHLEIAPVWFNKDTIDWVVMEDLLCIEDDFLFSDEIPYESYVEHHQDWDMYHDHNIVNQAIVSAALEDSETFEFNMKRILDGTTREASWYLEQKFHWSRLVGLKEHRSPMLWYVLNGLTKIEKTSWILPYLLRYADGWEAYAEEKQLLDKEPLFPVYKAIMECAENAYSEKDVSTEQQLDYLRISVRYQGYMDEITGTTYTLRTKEE